jgi:hypothetical protein
MRMEGETDRQTDMTKLSVALSNFAKALNDKCQWRMERLNCIKLEVSRKVSVSAWLA